MQSIANADELVRYLFFLTELSEDGIHLIMVDGQVKVGVLDIEIMPEDWSSKPVAITELPIPVMETSELQG